MNRLILNEDLRLPVAVLSESEIIDAAKKIEDGKKGNIISLGFKRDIKLSAAYTKGGLDKKSGEILPVVKALQCTEVRVRTGTEYGNNQKIINRNASDVWQQRMADRQAKIDAKKTEMGDAYVEKPQGIQEWIVPNIIGVNSRGNKVLTYWNSSNDRPKSKYYISIDGEDFRECSKEDIAPYATPADAAKLRGEYVVKEPAEGEYRSEDVGYRTVLLTNIYKLDSVGNTYMRTSSTNDGIEREASKYETYDRERLYRAKKEASLKHSEGKSIKEELVDSTDYDVIEYRNFDSEDAGDLYSEVLNNDELVAIIDGNKYKFRVRSDDEIVEICDEEDEYCYKLNINDLTDEFIHIMGTSGLRKAVDSIDGNSLSLKRVAKPARYINIASTDPEARYSGGSVSGKKSNSNLYYDN